MFKIISAKSWGQGMLNKALHDKELHFLLE